VAGAAPFKVAGAARVSGLFVLESAFSRGKVRDFTADGREL